MKLSQQKLRLGILGCGAIGNRIATSAFEELKYSYRLTGLYDQTSSKAEYLAKILGNNKLKKDSLDALLRSCDLMVEAVNSPQARRLIRAALAAKKHVLAMSVGKLLDSDDLLALARRNRCRLLIPSGAIAGIDAVKAASLKRISKIVLTTRKPLSGFADLPYVKERGIRLSEIKGEQVLFEGNVAEAVKHFPQNINVAATLALASRGQSKMLIRIMTSPEYRSNSHEIEISGDFGRMTSRTENVVCPDNPKTSYLAVLSAIQTLKDFPLEIKIGT